MKRPPLSSLLSLIVFHAAAACSVDAAPSNEEMLAALPNPIIRPTGGDYTNWTISEILNFESRAVVTYRSKVSLRDGNGHPNFVVTEGYFQARDSTIIGPTAKFIEATRPDDLDGGTWQFRYVALEVHGTYISSIVGDSHVAYWTWTQDPPSTATPPAATNSGAKVRMSLDLNRAVARSLRGKESRKVLSLLKRQQNLLDEALAATQ